LTPFKEFIGVREAVMLVTLNTLDGTQSTVTKLY